MALQGRLSVSVLDARWPVTDRGVFDSADLH